ncbi:SPH3 [Auxenochlorella protothecoides x Auxenochlorella symbiontica]
MQPSKTTQQGPLDREVRFALVSDLDWTMVDHNDHTHDKLLRLNHVWNTDLSHDSLLVYSTGRSPHLYEELAAEVPLLVPDILVCSVGTEILFQGVPHKPWSDFLDRGWDREKTLEIAQAEPALTLQDASEQRPHKISFKVSSGSDAVVQELTAKLKQAGLEVNVIYSAGVDLDLLPAAASKGKALAFLLEEMDGGAGRPRDGVLVAGDSGNDIELFAVAGVHGCMVANAHPELRAWCDAHASSTLFQASEDGPGAIFQALEHFEFVKHAEPRPAGVAVRRAVVGMTTAAAELFCGIAPQPPTDTVARLGEFLSDDFFYKHEGVECGKQEYLDYLGGPGYGGMAQEAAGRGEWREWLGAIVVREGVANTWKVEAVERVQPFKAGDHTGDVRRTYRVCMELQEAEPGRWLVSRQVYETLKPGEAYNSVPAA